MKNVISELYYGNIDPQARGFKNGSFLKKQMANGCSFGKRSVADRKADR